MNNETLFTPRACSEVRIPKVLWETVLTARPDIDVILVNIALWPKDAAYVSTLASQKPISWITKAQATVKVDPTLPPTTPSSVLHKGGDSSETKKGPCKNGEDLTS